ncbi:hypothetical protein MKW94_006424 [Papaver nudicaule]|uniref:S-acyltransferase n=1 Tax=Papaver nudicaule TaxID=74823 RepID=A0AA41UUI5_PAPNU|nr:hypothetical protein [Papaver nudicaule]MCL7031466.1 hypothetical protein [Papaver nudicaule]
MALSKPKPKRLYQVWKGSNRFFCGGRMIFGPDVASLFLSTLLICVPALVFCSQVLKKIEKHDPCLGYPVLAVALAITALDLVFLFMTSGRDPGIVPRNLKPPDSEDGLDATTPSMEWVNGRTPHLKLPRTKDVLVNGHSVRVKFCDTCLLYRPPRASHCSICNNCVQRFDHHCPWVGQCVGIRNYRFFFLFISFSTFLCIYVFVFSWINILEQKNEDTLRKTLSREVLSVILIVYCFIAVWFVGGLTVFHSYLICTNQTTYENFRYRYDKNENPHNRGMLANIKIIFFSKMTPSLNNFQALVVEEDHSEDRPITPIAGGNVTNSKERIIDIDTTSKVGEVARNLTLPEILQNLDYTDIDDGVKHKDSDVGVVTDPVLFSDRESSRDLERSSTHDIISIKDEGSDEGNNSHRAMLATLLS